jgi:SAM-dependent methyltransferase
MKIDCMAYTGFDRWLARQRFRAALPHLKPHARVCDVGCGLGTAFLDYAYRRIASGVAIDDQVVPSVGRWQSIRADITCGLPVESAAFDHVVMLAVLEHLPNPDPILREVFRVLAPGGSLILTWPQAVLDPLLYVLRKAGLISQEMESQDHQPRVPLSDLQNLLRTIGFTRFLHRRFEFGLNNLLVAKKTIVPGAGARLLDSPAAGDLYIAPGVAAGHRHPQSIRIGS